MTDETKQDEGKKPDDAPRAKNAPENITIADADPMTLRYDSAGAEVKAKFFKKHPIAKVKAVPGYHKLTLGQIAAALGGK